jgi:hypothetical protein
VNAADLIADDDYVYDDGDGEQRVNYTMDLM